MARAFASHAIEIGIPHVTGRAIDALLFTEETLGRPVPSHLRMYTPGIYLAAVIMKINCPLIMIPEKKINGL